MGKWAAFSYCEIVRAQFTAEECARIIALHQAIEITHSEMPGTRDCDLFWVRRAPETEWVFARIWDIATRYNARYGYALLPPQSALQLTRYTAGQRYNWHMDLGGNEMSIRKISLTVELAPAGSYQGGGLEVFYGEHRNNRLALGQGDAAVFHSFVIHRALPVLGGARWSLVAWLCGTDAFA